MAYPFMRLVSSRWSSASLIPPGWVGAQPWKPRPFGVQGVRQKDGSMGYRVKKWGNGAVGDHNARWRKGRGLSHGMRSKKFIVGKTSGVL